MIIQPGRVISFLAGVAVFFQFNFGLRATEGEAGFAVWEVFFVGDDVAGCICFKGGAAQMVAVLIMDSVCSYPVGVAHFGDGAVHGPMMRQSDALFVVHDVKGETFESITLSLLTFAFYFHAAEINFLFNGGDAGAPGFFYFTGALSRAIVHIIFHIVGVAGAFDDGGGGNIVPEIPGDI